MVCLPSEKCVENPHAGRCEIVAPTGWVGFLQVSATPDSDGLQGSMPSSMHLSSERTARTT